MMAFAKRSDASLKSSNLLKKEARVVSFVTDPKHRPRQEPTSNTRALDNMV
jgi:hypothetical protein